MVKIRVWLSGVFLSLVIFKVRLKWLCGMFVDRPCEKTIYLEGSFGPEGFAMVHLTRMWSDGWFHCPWPFPAPHSLRHHPPPTHLLPSVLLGINTPLVHYTWARLEWKLVRPDISVAQESLPSSFVTHSFSVFFFFNENQAEYAWRDSHFPFIYCPPPFRSALFSSLFFFFPLSACLFVCGRSWPRWFKLLIIIYLLAKVPSCLPTCKDCRSQLGFFFSTPFVLEGSTHQLWYMPF